MDDDARAQLVDRLATAVEAIEDRLDTMQESLAFLAARVGLGAKPIAGGGGTGDEPRRLGRLARRALRPRRRDPGVLGATSAVAEELKALNIAWVGANDPIDGRPPDLLLWHEALQRCVGRIREWDRAKCRTRGHAA